MTASHTARPLVDRRHRLGHDVIDSELVALSNCWLHAVNCAPMEFPLRMARLKKLMLMHFDHESALLAELGYALCRYHHNEHRMLLEMCDQISTFHERDWKKAQSLLKKKFPELFREHIITMDQCAVFLIETNGGSANIAKC
jgi:hemerythrin